jgi:3-oxoadipate enol-lactonase/4-carboxymuconolactone decarboxylase
MPVIRSSDLELFYDLSGPETAPVVAFSNSLGATLEMWEAQAVALSQRYRCLRYDARGHGRSETFDRPTTIDDLADDLAGLLDALDIGKAHVVGLSIGGMTAQALAARHPERVTTLALLASSAGFGAEAAWRDRAALVRRDGVEAVVDLTIDRWFSPGFREAAPDTIARARERFLATDGPGYARCCEVIATTDLRDRLGAISVPTLIVVGADDAATPPAMSEDMRQRIAGSELVTLSGARHQLAIERADAVNAHLMAFFARHGGAADFDRGLAVRTSVLGADYVDAALRSAGDFGAPWQDFITRYAWGEIWGDPTLPRKTRSLITLAMMVALHREEEFKMHVRPALGNGVSVEEMRAMVKQAAVYAGVPAGNAAIRWMREVFGEEL